MDYSQHMLARAEHNLIINSLPVVSENRSNGTVRRPAQWMRGLWMSILSLIIK